MPDTEHVQPQEPVARPSKHVNPKEPERDSRGRFASVIERLEQNTKLNQALSNGDLDPADYPEDTFTPEEFARARNAREKRGITSRKPETPSDPHKLGPEPKDDIGFNEFSKLRAEGLTGHEDPQATPEVKPDAQESPEQKTEREQFEAQRVKHEDFIRKTAAKMVTDPELVTALHSIRDVGAPEGVIASLGMDLAEMPNGIEVLKAIGKAPHLLHVLNNQTVEGGRAILRELSAEVANSAPRPRQTQAPVPPSPVQARATVSAFDVNDETMSPEQWALKRNREIAKRRR